ncbi:MAG TPA: undecaprenyl-diphosphatase UppP [Bellilinea sp.]|nr:undecaprenyl-diphosphatase UppP [Bellilinea sp.]
MTIFQAIVLGIVQGLTEFLPVSSSAHLVLVPYLLKWNIPADFNFAFDVLVQLGTLVAVITYFWKDLLQITKAMISGIKTRELFANPDARLGWLVLLATIPAGFAGLLLKNQVEAAFASPLMTAGFLMVTALLLLGAEFLGKRTRDLGDLNWKDALWIGFFQALSIFPGISRSGSTMAGGMTRNLERPASARFSFLMSIPIMLAAGLVSILDLKDIPNTESLLLPLIVGFIVAAIVGYFAIKWLISYISKHSFKGFAIYCLAAAWIVLLITYVR